MCISFPGAPGIISPSPYAGAGFPPTFAIPQAAGTVFRKLNFYIGFLSLKHFDVLELSSNTSFGVSHVNSKRWHLGTKGDGVSVQNLSQGPMCCCSTSSWAVPSEERK